jgi:hypothetical protein
LQQTQRKKKTCPICKSDFQPTRPLQRVDSPLCALEFNRRKDTAKRVKADRAALKGRKEALKSISDHLKDTQGIFNLYIRLRDYHQPCISCDQSAYQGQRHASHYRSRAAASQLRFNFINVWTSCAQCNSSKSGNVVEYRIRLADKIGEDRVLAIEHDNRTVKYTTEYLKRLQGILKRRIKHYKRLRSVD